MKGISELRTDLNDINNKVNELVSFLLKEEREPTITDSNERRLLTMELNHLNSLASVINDMIKYKMSKNDGTCSLSNNYEQAIKECFK